MKGLPQLDNHFLYQVLPVFCIFTVSVANLKNELPVLLYEVNKLIFLSL
jgi:hypothetical protein